ncbi:MAG: DUF2341 domain-containing protein [Candidatus Omnitrophica bacterium]|nr:DUF2341 domain-containing protein [Candidatus Omnitrophota bacterium]
MHPPLLKPYPFFLGLLALAATLTITSASHAVTTANPDIGILVIPDAQNEDANVINKMADWIVTNKDTQNIKAVIWLGDLTNNGLATQFNRHSSFFTKLKNAGIVNIPVVGNHDYDKSSPKSRLTTIYDQFLKENYPSQETIIPFAQNTYANYYVRLNTNQRKFLILALEFYPRPAIVKWASKVIAENPDHEVIIATHAYQNTNGTLIKRGDAQGPDGNSMPKTDSSGEDLWNNLISSNKRSNIRLVVCGHQIDGNHYSLRLDKGLSGVSINQIFLNYQWDAGSGGDGLMGLFKVSSTTNTASMRVIRTYSKVEFVKNPDYSLAWPRINALINVQQMHDLSNPLSSILSGTVTFNTSANLSQPVERITWSESKKLNPGPISISDPNKPVTRATFKSPGNYVLELTASKGTIKDTVTVVANTLPASDWYDPLWQYRKTIVFDHTKVSGDLNAFPVLISMTDPSLKTVTNGGKVAIASGQDIIFVDASGQKLSHEIEKYDPATGQIIAWAKLPYLSSITDTYIKMYFGNASAKISTDKNTLWDEKYLGVWHLDELKTPQNDSTKIKNNITAGTYVMKGIHPGKISGSDYYPDDDGYLQVSDTADIFTSEFNQMTISAWVSPQAYGPGTVISNTTTPGWALRINQGQLKPTFVLKGTGAVSKNLGNKIPLNEWSYVTVVYDGTDVIGYINGTPVDSFKASGIVAASKEGQCTFIGNEPTENCTIENPHRGFKGQIDEVRVSGKALSSDWIATEYANQSDPGSFMSVSSVQTQPVVRVRQ